MKKVVFVFVLTVLSGCAVTPADYAKCKELCEPNGGIKIVSGDDYKHCTCNNGLHGSMQ